ncbi:MAG: nucleotidyltransferase family protein [Gammaproteobacteria bacterium]|nr:nucleotidyltransferase family protein [Gammaproteobacteria bacterium]
MSRLGRQIEEVVAALNRIDARFALIGGLALASHKVVRATQDVDLLIDADRADEIDETLLTLGYRCVHHSVMPEIICAVTSVSIFSTRLARRPGSSWPALRSATLPSVR